MAKNWFSSDEHFGHNNIIRFCDRPFDSWWEMNEILIKNHNEHVGINDNIYFNGDFSFMSKGKTIEILKQLNGKKYFLAGNHDKPLFKRDSYFNIEIRPEVEPYVKWIKDYYELNTQDESAPRKNQLIVLGHYAKRVWNKSHWGAWNLYGHSHGTLPDDPNALSMDVGVDAVAKILSVGGILDPKDYRPISYDEVKAIMKTKQFKSIDQHGKKS